MKSLLLALSCVAAFGLSCSVNNDKTVEVTGTATPTPENPSTRAARLEADFQGGSVVATDNDGVDRTAARQAVSEFVRTNLPAWKIKGMSSQVYPGFVFSIDADLEKADDHQVVTFDTRKFFTESGDAYWLAVPVNKYRLDRLHELSDANVFEQLRDAKEQIRAGPEQP